MRSVRTDLAVEAHGLITSTLTGIETNEESKEGVTINRVAVKTEDAANAIGKPIGTYTTLSFPDARYIEKNLYETICKEIANELNALIKPSKGKPILVIGLGNRAITSDSLGPAVLDRLMITRHLFSYVPETISENLSSVCAIAPGVLGVTGIETEEIIRGVCKNVNPCAVICIDALAARSIDRITKTVQISNTGIHPGAGVGNNRKEISEKTLGVPVIAIGVPTVVDAATITDDTLNLVIDRLIESMNDEKDSAFYKILKDFSHEERYQLIASSVSSEMPHFMTTPKEIDLLIGKTAELVANGINFALHKDITFEDIQAFVS